LAVGCRRLAPGGRIGLILPTSILAARDAAAVRAEVTETCELTGLWVAGEQVFEASVDVCAPILRRHPGGAVPGRPRAVRTWRGRAFEPVGSGESGESVGGASAASTWSPLALPALGVPRPRHRGTVPLGSLVTATAGF